MLRVDDRKPLGLMIRPAVRVSGGSCPVAHVIDDDDRCWSPASVWVSWDVHSPQRRCDPNGKRPLSIVQRISLRIHHHQSHGCIPHALFFRAVRLNACYRAEYGWG